MYYSIIEIAGRYSPATFNQQARIYTIILLRNTLPIFSDVGRFQLAMDSIFSFLILIFHNQRFSMKPLILKLYLLLSTDFF